MVANTKAEEEELTEELIEELLLLLPFLPMARSIVILIGGGGFALVAILSAKSFKLGVARSIADFKYFHVCKVLVARKQVFNR